MSSNKNVQIIFGGASFASLGAFPEGGITEALDILEAGGVKTIDTAYNYIPSEALLGQANAASRFAIDTKYPGGFAPKPSSKENLVTLTEESLKNLQTDQVNTYYIHAPDHRIPFETLLSGINDLYKAGKFKRFGLSNFLASEVAEVIRIAKENNYVLPTVYQGNYNAVARHQETELFPVLREHGIAFYAYSPIAGGFLTKSVDQLLAGGQGRWDANTPTGAMYHALYKKEGMLEGLRTWEKISKESGIGKAELAYRWVVFHSGLGDGDAVIFGSRNKEQLSETLAAIENGPLEEGVVKGIEGVWEIVKDFAPLDNFNSLVKGAMKN